VSFSYPTAADGQTTVKHGPSFWTGDNLRTLHRHFRVDFVEHGASVILALSGELDIASSPELEAELDRAADRELVIVDLKGLEFIDSTGLGVLVKAHQQAQETGRRFALVRGIGQVERLLGLTGLSDQLPVAETREELLSET
jgi:anti-sigma B factor antagonist